MKILVTGANKLQNTRNHHLRQNLKVVPSHVSLVNALTAMGHEVTQRVTQLGEDLAEFDEVIVFIAGPRQLVAGFVYNCLWAIGVRPDCMLAVDDWAAPDLFKSMEKCLDESELFAPFILGTNQKTVEELLPFKEKMLEGVKTIAARKNRMLVSAFNTDHLNDPENFGPHLLFDAVKYPADRIFAYNPNPYHRNRTWADIGHVGLESHDFLAPAIALEREAPPAKERRFNFASLVQSKTKKWLKKQGFTVNSKDDERGSIGSWQVDLYGSKAESQKRLTEDKMVEVIYRDWGCLMPAYDHAGSGWWRARGAQCATANSILISDDKELKVYYGNDYPYYGLKATDLIELSDSELSMVAKTQREAFFMIHPFDKSVQEAELCVALKAPR